MKQFFSLAVVAVVAVSAMGCASKTDAPPTLRITGTVAQQSSALSGARAVATSSDGRSYSAVLSKTGQFAIDVPSGSTYRIVIANPTRAGELRVVGHLVSSTTQGTTDVIAVKDGGTLALGTLQPISTTATSPATPGAVKTMSAGANDHAEHEDEDQDDDSETGNENEGKESDDDGKLCQDGDDVELHAEHDPGPDHAAVADSAKPKASAKTCAVHDADHDGDDD